MSDIKSSFFRNVIIENFLNEFIKFVKYVFYFLIIFIASMLNQGRAHLIEEVRKILFDLLSFLFCHIFSCSFFFMFDK